MRVWLVTTGEPLPLVARENERLQRTGMIAKYLSRQGHAVTWWASTFDHYQKRHMFHQDSELPVAECLSIRLLHGSGYQRNLSYARIRDHRKVAEKFATYIREEPPPDIILVALPTLELCLAAVNYGNERGVPVVLDMRDMWPDIIVDTAPVFARSLSRLILSSMFHDAHLACAGATAIIGITDAFVDWGLKRGRRQRTELDKSFPFAYSVFPPETQEIARAENKWEALGIRRGGGYFSVCFFGSIGKQFDLGPAISAVREMRSDDSRIRLVICGTGERLEEYKNMAYGNPDIVFAGWVNAAEIYTLMRRSSAGIDPMPNRYDFLSTINNKAVEYLSAGLPVISSPNRGVLHDLLTSEQCGLTYPYGDARALADLLRRLAQERSLSQKLSSNAARVFNEKFAADKVCRDVMEHLNLVVDTTKRSRIR